MVISAVVVPPLGVPLHEFPHMNLVPSAGIVPEVKSIPSVFNNPASLLPSQAPVLIVLRFTKSELLSPLKPT